MFYCTPLEQPSCVDRPWPKREVRRWYKSGVWGELFLMLWPYLWTIDGNPVMFDYVWHSIKVLIRSSNPQSGSCHQIRLTKQILLFASQSFVDRFSFLTAFHHSAMSQHAKWPHPVLGCSGQVAQLSCGRRFNKRPCWIATTKSSRAFREMKLGLWSSKNIAISTTSLPNRWQFRFLVVF